VDVTHNLSAVYILKNYSLP